MTTIFASSFRHAFLYNAKRKLTQETLCKGCISQAKQLSTFASAGPSSGFATRGQQNAPGNSRGTVDRRPRSTTGFLVTAKYNRRLRNCKTSAIALEICSEMKEEGVLPDSSTYFNLMEALSKGANIDECWVVLQDMKQMGFKPDIEVYAKLLNAARMSLENRVHEVLSEIRSEGLEYSSNIYGLVIQYYTEGNNIETALRWLSEMTEKGLVPPYTIMGNLLTKLAQRGHARLSVDLAEAYEHTSLRKIDGPVWVTMLVACAEVMFAEGVQSCWLRVVHDLKIAVNEGLCVQVLNTAGRYGLPGLCAAVLQNLESLHVRLQEQHLAPLLEAFTTAEKMHEAFKAINAIRNHGIEPTLETVHKIVDTLQRDKAKIDGAFVALEENKQDGHPVDVLAVNAILQASALQEDLPRAIGLYKTMSSLEVEPDITTYNILIGSCAKAGHDELGNRMYQDMKERKITPDQETYKCLILLSLSQADYENSFFFLEEMKARGFKPPLTVYEALIKKCVSVGDNRYKLAIEELEQKGYKVSSSLEGFIRTGGFN